MLLGNEMSGVMRTPTYFLRGLQDASWAPEQGSLSSVRLEVATTIACVVLRYLDAMMLASRMARAQTPKPGHRFKYMNLQSLFSSPDAPGAPM